MLLNPRTQAHERRRAVRHSRLSHKGMRDFQRWNPCQARACVACELRWTDAYGAAPLRTLVVMVARSVRDHPGLRACDANHESIRAVRAGLLVRVAHQFGGDADRDRIAAWLDVRAQ